MISHITVILNPIAGKGHAERNAPYIQKRLEEQQLPFTIIRTEYPGHAKELAFEAGQIAGNATIAAGGDGTINEVINGLMDQKTVKTPILGIIPIGRGNDFAFGASVPHDLEESLSIICQGAATLIDIGKVTGGDYPEGRWFGNGIGIGFDTIVGLEAEKMKHIHGAAGYAIGALKTIITYPKPPLLEIRFNGGVQTVAPVLVSIMNGKRMGGAFFMAPEGCNTDGLLNLCMTIQRKRGRMLRDMLHYLKGTQAGLDDTFMHKAPGYTIKAIEGSMAVHADGETICISGKELEVSCSAKAVRLLTKTSEKGTAEKTELDKQEPNA